MNVVALDTSTEVLAVAACFGGDKPRRFVVSRQASLRHTSRVLQYVQYALDELDVGFDQLDVVACMRGPGSFTGLRIGMATAKGLAQALSARKHLAYQPIASFDTLRTMAYRHRHSEHIVLPVIDGRKDRYYWAAYQGHQPLVPASDSPVESILARLQGHDGQILVTGAHAAEFVAALGQQAGRDHDLGRFLVDAEYAGAADALLVLAAEAAKTGAYDPIDLGPFYLRQSDAEIGITSPKTRS